MINPNILKILESNLEDPSYSIIISKFEQPEFCNKDKLNIIVEQYNPNLEKIIENNKKIIENLKETLIENNIEVPDLYELEINSCIEKTLSIESLLDYEKKDGLFVSRLTGNLENDINKGVPKKLIKGKIENNKVTITEKDVPNYFNKSKFKLKQNQFIISFPKKIESFICVFDNLTEGESNTYTQNDLTDDNLIIDIDPRNASYNFVLSYTFKNDLIDKSIETITTQLSKEIEIEFNNQYKDLPAVILTIDEDKKIYTSYNLKFQTNIDNEYTGVRISFNNFKRQKNYGDINITIIGDK